MKITPPLSIIRLDCLFAGMILLLLLNVPSQLATAAPVTSKQAAAVVTGWLSMNPAPLGETLGSSIQRVDTFNDQAGDPVYYVVCLEPSGFVIVAADDSVEPIVGFASAGQYDPSTDNPLGALVSNDLSARVAYAQQAGSAPADTNALRAQAKWQQLAPTNGGLVITPKGLTTVSDVRIAPLTQTTWDQETAAAAGSAACYNYYTPPYANGSTANYPAGCVATAMAQLCGTISSQALASGRQCLRFKSMAQADRIPCTAATARAAPTYGATCPWSLPPFPPQCSARPLERWSLTQAPR